MRIRYFVREERELLSESLETIQFISEEFFEELLSLGIYKYYGFDYRCDQILFILVDIPKYYKDYSVWLGIEVVK